MSVDGGWLHASTRDWGWNAAIYIRSLGVECCLSLALFAECIILYKVHVSTLHEILRLFIIRRILIIIIIIVRIYLFLISRFVFEVYSLNVAVWHG